MGRTPCCVKVGLNRGTWTADEDLLLSNYVQTHGEGGWRTLPVKAGLLRCGKSCRLRWMNYLRPDVKRGKILPEEEDLILRLHRLLGNRWSLIAGRMPGRTDNEIKNYWNTHLSKKLLTQGINPRTHKPICATAKDSDISPNSPVKEMLQSSSPVCENLADIGTSEKKGAAATEKGGGSTRCPQKNNIHESNSEALCVPVDISCINMYLPLPSLVKWEDLGMPYVVQQNLNDTDNVGSNQISLSPTSGVGGVAHHHGDNHSSFTTSFELRSSYSSQSALWNSSDASDGTVFQKQQVSQGLQALEAELRNSGIVRPLMTASNKLSYMNCAGTASSFPYPNTMGSAFGDYSSDMFSSLLESFTEEELRLSQASSAPQPCPNQPDSANLSYDLWSLLSPSAQYHPLT